MVRVRFGGECRGPSTAHSRAGARECCAQDDSEKGDSEKDDGEK